MADPQSFIQTRDLQWRSGEVALGGRVMEAERYIGGSSVFITLRSDVFIDLRGGFGAPTILTDAVEADAVTQQGAGGPVLPVLSVAGMDEAAAFVGRREKPLCVDGGLRLTPTRLRASVRPSVHLHDNQVVARLTAETSSGVFYANDVHAVQSMRVGLACGGVGEGGPPRGSLVPADEWDGGGRNGNASTSPRVLPTPQERAVYHGTFTEQGQEDSGWLNPFRQDRVGMCSVAQPWLNVA
ncbi:unnamed protein product [Arctogadus glacialis]